jgi:FlaG/FlaF family flagellin (archaellin)
LAFSIATFVVGYPAFFSQKINMKSCLSLFVDDDGVSEIIGTLLLLVITVILFSVVLAWAGTMKPPERIPYADLYPYLEDGHDGWGNGNEQIVIGHRGGEPLLSNNLQVVVRIDDRELKYERNSLKFPNGYLYMGENWHTDAQRINQNSTVYAVVYYLSENGAVAIMPEQRLVPRARSSSLPDLTIYPDEITYVPPVISGQDVVVRAVIKNTGRGDSTSFKVALFDGSADEGKIISTAEVTLLKSNSQTTVQLLYADIPFDPTKETRDVTIVVDYLNEVQEINERNNIAEFGISARGRATISLIENFEYGAEGWTHGGKGDEWELGGPTEWEGPEWLSHPDTAHWGSACWGTDLSNTYNNNANFWLMSPEVDLTNAKSANLTFYQWYNFESEWDFGILQITTDGGESWQDIMRYTGSSTDWSYENIDLSGYIGNTIQVRFLVTTDKYGTAAGWYIDDLTLLGERRV